MGNLPPKLQKSPFTLRQAKEQGLSYYDLGKLVSNGRAEQVARGIYRAAGSDIDDEEQYRIATLRVGTPSAICLLSALSRYNLTDIIAKKTWIMVPVQKRTSDRTLKLFRSRNPNWKIGIRKEARYTITTIERTLVDCLSQRSRLGINTSISALRKALETKKTTLGKVIDMAKELGVLHRILPYIEALS
jgi:predicted transcriptional regulator of viral defense system